MSKFTNKIFFIFSIFFAFVTALGFLSLLLFASFFQDIPDYEELANYMPSGITRLYDSNGEILENNFSNDSITQTKSSEL